MTLLWMGSLHGCFVFYDRQIYMTVLCFMIGSLHDCFVFYDGQFR